MEERAKPVNWSEVEFCFARIIQTAFQSPWRKWWRLDSISVEDLDRASTSEAVGGGELYRFGSFTSAVKIAFRGIAVKHSSIRVIMTAWLALPNTVFGPLTGIAHQVGPHSRCKCHLG